MNEMFIGAYWRERPLTYGAFLAHASEFLGALPSAGLKPARIYLQGDGPGSKVEVVPGSDEFYRRTRALGFDPKYKNYSEFGHDGSPLLAATSPVGFTLSFSDSPGDKVTSSALNINITAGAHNPRISNAVLVSLPQEGACAVVSVERIRALMQLIVEFWKPAQAIVTSSDFNDEAFDSKQPMGWITYVADPKACEAVPSGIACEPFGEGALLTIADAMPEVGDALALARIRDVRDALRAQAT